MRPVRGPALTALAGAGAVTAFAARRSMGSVGWCSRAPGLSSGAGSVTSYWARRRAGSTCGNGRIGEASRAFCCDAPGGCAALLGPGEPVLVMESAPLGFHHCMDIWASISSIFLSVMARSSGLDGRLLWKNDGRMPCASAGVPSRLRILRSMSNSRLRTKSLRRLRSIIAFNSDFSISRSLESCREFRSAQSVAGLATKRTTLRKKLSLPSFGSDISAVQGVEAAPAAHQPIPSGHRGSGSAGPLVAPP